VSEPVPALVTLHLWRVESAGVPRAVLRMGRDRARVRRTPGVRFAKLLGTGDGRTFTVRDADPRRWGLLATWTSLDAVRDFERRSPVAAAWRELASEAWRVDLRPVASRGTWSGRQPFGDPVPARSDGPVAALTRARLRPSVATSFWRSVPPVSADLRDRPGLRAAVGIGEAPLGLQGTFSLWESGAAVRAFARGAAHAAVVARTAPERWYAEELFARFDVVGSTGTLDGRDPLA
jgi:heme-degrading monooxygenase HmoA